MLPKILILIVNVNHTRRAALPVARAALLSEDSAAVTSGLALLAMDFLVQTDTAKA